MQAGGVVAAAPDWPPLNMPFWRSTCLGGVPAFFCNGEPHTPVLGGHAAAGKIGGVTRGMVILLCRSGIEDVRTVKTFFAVAPEIQTS